MHKFCVKSGDDDGEQSSDRAAGPELVEDCILRGVPTVSRLAASQHPSPTILTQINFQKGSFKAATLKPPNIVFYEALLS